MIRAVMVAVGMVLVVAGCEQQAPPAAPPQEVAVYSVTPEKVILTTELPGRTSGYLVAEIRPQVNGLIQKRLFTEGADVKAGEVLYQIDPAPFQAVLDNALAALARSQASVSAVQSRATRYEELLAEKAVSQQDYDDAVAQFKQDEADVEYWKAMVQTARINLGYAQVTAPISGRIGRSSVTDGAIVTAYQPVALATIQQLDPIYVDVPQSTTELNRLKHALASGRLDQNGTDQVKIVLEDGRPYPHPGTLKFRDVTVDPTTGSVILRIVVPNPDGTLLPGMFVRAILEEGVNEQALLVPQLALARDPKGNPSALIVNAQGNVEQRRLTTERALGDKWLVTAGLAPGERVIVEGVQKVRPGMPVKAVPYEGAATSDSQPATQTQLSKHAA